MLKFPTFEDLYKEYQEQVISDSNHQLNDFTPGSRLDAFAAVSATAAQQVMRYIGKIITGFFIQSATGDALDRIINDRYPEAWWLKREAGEDDEHLKERVYSYIAIKSRGTFAALKYYVNVLKKNIIKNASVVENFQDGIVEIRGSWMDGVNKTNELLVLSQEIESWRPAGVFVYIKIKD